MGGGDLLNLLIERDVFEEDFTRFYVAEVCPSSYIRRLPCTVMYPDALSSRIMSQTRVHTS